jgi:hypothetical protein
LTLQSALRNFDARFEDFYAPLRSGCNQSKPLQVRRADQERAVVVKTTRITIETENLLVVHRAKTTETWCTACCANVEVIMLERDSLSEDIPSSYLGVWLRTGKLHLWRTAQGSAQLCLPSLLQCIQAEAVPRLGEPKTHPKTGEKR